MVVAGKGAVYTYDAVGSFERIGYACQGSAQKLIIPLLDNLVGHRNRADPDVPLTRDQVLEIVKDSFVTAGEVCGQVPRCAAALLTLSTLWAADTARYYDR